MHQLYQNSFCRCIKFFRTAFVKNFGLVFSSFLKIEAILSKKREIVFIAYYSRQMKVSFSLLSMLFTIKLAF